MLVYSPVQLSRVILNPLYSSFPKAQQDFTGHDECFIGKTRKWYFLNEKKKIVLVSGILVHCKSVTTVHKQLGFCFVFYWGIRIPSDCFNIKYNSCSYHIFFIRRLLNAPLLVLLYLTAACFKWLSISSSLDQYKYITQLALWKKKKRERWFLSDRIQQGNRS